MGIDLYITSPLNGNLHCIVSELKKTRSWPLKRANNEEVKWRIKMYSGQYNMKGLQPLDLEALKELVSCSDEPLVDVARFPFFGGKNAHPITASLKTFVTPTFAKEVSAEWPETAAMLKIFNHVKIAELISPTGLKWN